jgi:hypothetical protein
MPTEIYIANGTTIGVDKTGSGTYVTLANVESFDGPSNTVGSVETTNLSSGRKTYRPGLPDSGEISFDIQFDPADADHTYLRGLLDSPAVKSWQLSYPTLPKATLDTFDGFLTEFHPSGDDAEGILTASITIKLTGAIVTTTAP